MKSRKSTSRKVSGKRGQGPRNPATAQIREINWSRDLGQKNVPARTKDQLDALSFEHTDVRKVLDVLRATRAQRSVGALKIPVDLREGAILDSRGVEMKNGISPILGPED